LLDFGSICDIALQSFYFLRKIILKPIKVNK